MLVLARRLAHPAPIRLAAWPPALRRDPLLSPKTHSADQNLRPLSPMSAEATAPNQNTADHQAFDQGARPKVKRKRDPYRRAVLLVSIPLTVATLVFAVLLVYNNVLGGGKMFVPYTTPFAIAATAGEDGDGTYQATVRYTSEITLANGSDDLGMVSAPLFFDDSWFDADADPYAYNHELAQAAAVLSAVVNAESAFYGGRTDVDFAEEALGALGFSDISTTSFQKRSAATDEVMAVFTGETDVSAYALARKTLSDGRDLVFVCARGTFGSEWLSNFNIKDSQSLKHRGFTSAETEVIAALDAYCAETGVDPEGAVVLVCGHSRGGAVANLLAAELDDRMAGIADEGEQTAGDGRADQRAGQDDNPADAQTDEAAPQVIPSAVWAYTFASPNTTQSDATDNELYDNIFNVINSTDLVARLPLSEWGWDRYGVDVLLPDPSDPTYPDAYEAMQEYRGAITGFYNAKSPFSDTTDNFVDKAEQRLAKSIPDLDSLMTFDGIVSLFASLGSLNVGHVVASHYPDTYIGWLETLDVGQLTLIDIDGAGADREVA